MPHHLGYLVQGGGYLRVFEAECYQKVFVYLVQDYMDGQDSNPHHHQNHRILRIKVWIYPNYCRVQYHESAVRQLSEWIGSSLSQIGYSYELF